jgi:hypothetical protein
VTDARSFTIDNGYIFDTLDLTTPYERLYMNNQLSQPVNGPDVQLFAPNYAFFLNQNSFRSTTTTFVVQYDGVAEIVDELPTGTILGASFVRDFDRQGRIGDTPPFSSADEFGAPPSWALSFSQNPPFVGVPGVVAEFPGVVATNLGVGGETWEIADTGDGLNIVVKRKKKR